MPLIAVDADGVLLDYNLAYSTAWQRAFGTYPKERERRAYWALDRWDVERLTGDRLDHFRACFDSHFWSTLPAIEGAKDACERLQAAGFDLVCVTAMDPTLAEARRSNLQTLGFPIEHVVTTVHTSSYRSPKAEALERLRPVAFVDDYLPYLRGVQDQIHTALINRDSIGSPNVGPDLSAAKSLHEDLGRFADWWLSR